MLAWFQELMQRFGSVVMDILPLSPFQSYINNMAVPEGVGWLNWFIPVPEMLQVFSAWLVAYGLYLLARIILRWIKAVS